MKTPIAGGPKNREQTSALPMNPLLHFPSSDWDFRIDLITQSHLATVDQDHRELEESLETSRAFNHHRFVFSCSIGLSVVAPGAGGYALGKQENLHHGACGKSMHHGAGRRFDFRSGFLDFYPGNSLDFPT
jgi:hypothetical protein